jgi:hypothetical protein
MQKDRSPDDLSGDFPTPSPPAEKTTARQDQAGQACTRDGGGNCASTNSFLAPAVLAFFF